MNVVLDEKAFLPIKEHETDAAYDLCVKERTHILPNRQIIKTGVHIQLPHGYCAMIMGRSGMTAKGIKGEPTMMANGEERDRYDADVLLGLVDEGYTGELGIIVNNHDQHFFVRGGEAIAQMLILKCETLEMQAVDSLNDTQRGEQGFNS